MVLVELLIEKEGAKREDFISAVRGNTIRSLTHSMLANRVRPPSVKDIHTCVYIYMYVCMKTYVHLYLCADCADLMVYVHKHIVL